MRNTYIRFLGTPSSPASAGIPWFFNSNQVLEGKMLKNVEGQNITALLLDTDGAAVTAGTTTVYVTGNAGTQSSMGTATHEGNGEWSIDVTAAECNYDDIGFTWINTGAITVHQHVFTDQSYDRIGAAGVNLTAVSADMTAISGDTTAADNLEAMYDATGYVADTAPATQSQISNIANVGSAVHTPASSYTLTTGTQSANLYTDTASLNGTRHTHTSTGGELVLEYVFNIGSGTPSSITLTGALTGINDDLEVMAYDYVAASYVQVGVLDGKSSTTNAVYSYDLYTSMVGSGASLGEVKLKFQDGSYTLTTATLYIDQIYTSFSSATSGYELGSIWVDDSVSNTNTVIGVDGVATNPVSTWAAALILSASTNLNKFQIANGTSITLTGNSDNFTLIGDNWTLALGGQSIDASSFQGAIDVTGISEATTSQPTFRDCGIGAVTLPPSRIYNCGFGKDSGTFTAAIDSGEYIIEGCYSLVPGAGSPVFDFSPVTGNTGINNRGWRGGSTYTLDSNCTLSHEVLAGGGTTITTGGADVEIRGITRSLNITMSAAEDVQFVGTTGPITLSGTTTANVNLYGVSASISDTTSAATVVDKTVNQDNINIEVDTAISDASLATAAALSTHDGKLDTVDGIVDSLLSLLDDARTEPGQGAPPVNPDSVTKIDYLYKAWRNKVEQTATTWSLYDDAGSTVDQKATVADNGTTASMTEKVSGP